jgi:PAS domain S-box-containing protein
LDFALDAAGVGYWSLNLVTRVATRSRLHDRIFGYPSPPPEWTFEKFLQHVEPAERAPVLESFERAKQSGEDWQVEARIRRIDGSERWIAVHARRERSEGSSDPFMLGVVTDITERKRAAIAHDARLQEMERTVRFSELFIGILSHDLRNPLSAITTAASALLKRGEDADKIVAPAGRILKSAGRMARMIDQLLDFTRVRLGNGIPLQQSSTDLAAVCRAATEELVGDGQSRIRLTVVGEPVGEWDRDRLAQLVSNLLGNALAHGKPGSPVRIRIDGTGARAVRLEVHNDGMIPDQLLPVLFEPFRSTGEKRQGASGLGLGLYISKQVVLAHGGTLDVSSTEHDGVCFAVELPRSADSSTSAGRNRLLGGQAGFTHGQHI